MGFFCNDVCWFQFNWFLLCCFMLMGVSDAAASSRRIGRPFWLRPIFCAHITAVICIMFASFCTNDVSLLSSPSTTKVRRVRRNVTSLFKELGPTYVRRAYRMEESDFWKLHRLLYIKIGYKVFPRRGSKKKHKNGGPNGIISSTIRLSAAMRYFAGGSAYDIALTHGISYTEVFYSVWRVVNAINSHPSLIIRFPEDYAT